MKNIFLLFSIVFLSSFAFSQNCARVVSLNTVVNPDGSYTATVTYNSDGQKHVFVNFYCNNVLIPGKSFCESFQCQSNCTSTISYTFVCSGTPTVTFLPYTGTCQGGTVCGPEQTFTPVPRVLPVNISSFLVVRTGCSISVNWKTESDVNTAIFEIQRAYDNSSFQTVGIVPGNSFQSYLYIDNTNNSKNISFYRIKIVKQNGEISYSDIKTVKGFTSKANFIVFPNPSTGNSKIIITDLNEPSKIQLIDNTGRLVKSVTLTGNNSVELNGLQNGIYMVKITGSISLKSEIRKLTIIN